MRHRVGGRKLQRLSHRAALFRNMAAALIRRTDHDDRRQGEGASPLCREAGHARRVRRPVEPPPRPVAADGRVQLAKLFDVIAPRYANRNGGYTRVIKAGIRVSDAVPIAMVEFIDRDVAAKGQDSGPVMTRISSRRPERIRQFENRRARLLPNGRALFLAPRRRELHRPESFRHCGWSSCDEFGSVSAAAGPGARPGVGRHAYLADPHGQGGVTENHFGSRSPIPIAGSRMTSEPTSSEGAGRCRECRDQPVPPNAAAARLVQAAHDGALNYERFGLPVKKAGHDFYTHNSGLQNQSVLLRARRSRRTPRQVIDPNGWSADGATALAEWTRAMTDCFLSIQDGGTDWRSGRVMDVATGKFCR